MLAAAKDGFRLKPEQAAGLARRWLEQRLEEGNSHLTELVDTGDVHETQDGPEAVRESRAAQELSYMQEDHERGRAERWVTDDVDHAIREEGLPIKEGDESYRLLVDQFFWAAVALRQAMNARAFGDYRQPKQLEKLPDYKPVLANGNSAAKVHRLSDAVEVWKAESVPTAQTEHEWRTAAKRFAALHGDKPVDPTNFVVEL